MSALQADARRDRCRTRTALAALTAAGLVVGVGVGLLALALDPGVPSVRAPAQVTHPVGGASAPTSR